jgi:hypothetical protein
VYKRQGDYLNIIKESSVPNEIQYCPKNDFIFEKIYTICTNDTVTNNFAYISDPWKINFDRPSTSIINYMNTNYIIIGIPITLSAPNLYNVFKYTCDNKYNNDSIEDIYIPYLTKCYLIKDNDNIWIHNVPIEINKTTIIKLNDIVIENIIPLRSNQFYISDQDNIKWLYSSAEDLDKTNINQLYTFIRSNDDYSNIMLNMIKMIDEEYINIFDKVLSSNKEIYGTTSLSLIEKLPKYTTCDILLYSHYIPRLTKDDLLNLLPIKLKYIQILKIDLFKSYNSYHLFKLRNYLSDVNQYFINIIKYINDNIDYLKITNSKQYNDELITIAAAKEFIESKFSKIDTKGKPIILSLIHI